MVKSDEYYYNTPLVVDSSPHFLDGYMMNLKAVFRIVGLVLGLSYCSALVAEEGRRVISLDGKWMIGEGGMDKPTWRYDFDVPVPGLVDMAEARKQPSAIWKFHVPGLKHINRQGFWYSKIFQVKDPVPAVALLKINKAKFGTRVFLNDKHIGDHWPCFTPSYFNIKEALKGDGEYNRLLIRVGGYWDVMPKEVPFGWDFEKLRYMPGIYDSVKIILSDTPNIVRIQTVPDIQKQQVGVQVVLTNHLPNSQATMVYGVKEVSTGRLVGQVDNNIQLGTEKEQSILTHIPIKDCRLWSPEDPFLYELTVKVKSNDKITDSTTTRFGMRSFTFDNKAGRAILNGKPYFMRGTNICIFRFFEDAQRGDKPWDKEWVRRLLRQFKKMNWNSVRYCIGFPPEIWYEVADEEGLLIQDEFPIWHLYVRRHVYPTEQLVKEYSDWIHERCNHPCVVIWDAQNETVTPATGEAIAKVRGLDLSNRPWNNGWSPPGGPNDCLEAHPYLFSNYNNRLSDLAEHDPVPNMHGKQKIKGDQRAIIINEYGWLWLQRDGTPTTLSKKYYDRYLGPNQPVDVYRKTYARHVAALTEFWRCHRKAAGVLHLGALSYSIPGTETSDPLFDVDKPSFDPYFEKHVRDAFSPVGLMVDEWAESLPGGQERKIEVVVINDLYKDWEGDVHLRVLDEGGKAVWEQNRKCKVVALGDERIAFQCKIPVQPGDYQLAASLTNAAGESVTSLRDFKVLEEKK